MNIEIENIDDMKEYIHKYKYLIVFPDKTIQLFKSLREIENSILISASTISKKLKLEKKLILTQKDTNYVFSLHLLD